MTVNTLTSEFTDEDRKVLAKVLRDIAIGYPDYHHTLRSSDKDHRDAIPAEVRALKSAALNKEPFPRERVALALAAAKHQYAGCVKESDPAHWRQFETGIDVHLPKH